MVPTKNFPLDNIAFLLFLDIVDRYDILTTSEMRYIRPETKQFWEVGYRLFKGKFLRFMAGPKNTGNVTEGLEKLGSCQASKSKMNFAVPSLTTLGKQKLVPIEPGILNETIESLSKCITSKVIKIGVDGKKIARGKGTKMGDIDCWGFEQEPNLKERLARFEEEQALINSSLRLTIEFDESGITVIPLTSSEDILHMITNIVVMLSKRVSDLRISLVKVNLSIEKFKTLGDQIAKTWTKSKYVPLISSLKVSKYEMERSVEQALCFINQFCYLCATLNGKQSDYCLDGKLDISTHPKYHQLKSNISSADLRYVKQKSDLWFEERKKAKVSESSCNIALGLGKLKQQQAHFDKVVLGKIEETFTDEQRANMDYGTRHEIDGIATVVSRVLPAFYPELKYFEEGCCNVPNRSNECFMVASPDGSLRACLSQPAKVMYENKCKTSKVYSTPVCYEIPKYYIPQLLCEMHAYECDQLLVSCWSLDSTTVFLVQYEKGLWDIIWQELCATYAIENPKRPTKFTPNRKQIQTQINDFCTNNIKLVGEFPSCSVLFTPADVCFDGCQPHTSFSSSGNNENCAITFEMLLKNLNGLVTWHNSVYRLCRTSATEILLFMANDLNRNYHAELNNAHPIAYALTGPSMTNDIFRQMFNSAVNKCEE